MTGGIELILPLAPSPRIPTNPDEGGNQGHTLRGVLHSRNEGRPIYVEAVKPFYKVHMLTAERKMSECRQGAQEMK